MSWALQSASYLPTYLGVGCFPSCVEGSSWALAPSSLTGWEPDFVLQKGTCPSTNQRHLVIRHTPALLISKGRYYRSTEIKGEQI